MAEVNITIKDRSFRLGCDDGEEQHLMLLADHLGQHVNNLRKTMTKAGDEQLFLMAGLMVCDELWDARDQLLKAEERLRLQALKSAPTASPSKSPPPSSSSTEQGPSAAPLSQSSGKPVPAPEPSALTPNIPPAVVSKTKSYPIKT